MKHQNNDIDLRQLEIFCKIYELNSFSLAAKSLDLSQPTVSEHIKNLEASLKLKLIDRRGKKIEVTPAGKLFYSHAVQMLELKNKIFQEMNSFSAQIRGDLVIGASSIPGSYVLPEYISEFKKLYPDVIISLKVRDTEEVIQAVKYGYYEIGVVGGKPNYPDIKYTILCHDRLQLILSAEHPLAKRKSAILPEQMSKLKFVMREKGSAQRELMEKYFTKMKIPLHIAFEMEGNEAIKEAVKKGEGAAILSERAISKEIKAGQLKTIKIKDLKLERHFYTICHKQRTLSPVSQLFLDYTYQAFKE